MEVASQIKSLIGDRKSVDVEDQQVLTDRLQGCCTAKALKAKRAFGGTPSYAIANFLHLLGVEEVETLNNYAPSGSCQFASVSHQLFGGSDESLSSEIFRPALALRLAVCTFIEQHATFYSPFLQDPKSKTRRSANLHIDTFLKAMREETTDGNNVTMQALADMTRATIKIIKVTHECEILMMPDIIPNGQDTLAAVRQGGASDGISFSGARSANSSRGPTSSSNSTSPWENFIAPRRTIWLTLRGEAHYRSLRCIRFEIDEDDDEQPLCAICYSYLDVSQQTTLYPSPSSRSSSSRRSSKPVCSHGFHLHCIMQWSERENSCPLCKQKFRVVEGPPACRKVERAGSSGKINVLTLKLVRFVLSEDRSLDLPASYLPFEEGESMGAGNLNEVDGLGNDDHSSSQHSQQQSQTFTGRTEPTQHRQRYRRRASRQSIPEDDDAAIEWIRNNFQQKRNLAQVAIGVEMGAQPSILPQASSSVENEPQGISNPLEPKDLVAIIEHAKAVVEMTRTERNQSLAKSSAAGSKFSVPVSVEETQQLVKRRRLSADTSNRRRREGRQVASSATLNSGKKSPSAKLNKSPVPRRANQANHMAAPKGPQDRLRSLVCVLEEGAVDDRRDAISRVEESFEAEASTDSAFSVPKEDSDEDDSVMATLLYGESDYGDGDGSNLHARKKISRSASKFQFKSKHVLATLSELDRSMENLKSIRFGEGQRKLFVGSGLRVLLDCGLLRGLNRCLQPLRKASRCGDLLPETSVQRHIIRLLQKMDLTPRDLSTTGCGLPRLMAEYSHHPKVESDIAIMARTLSKQWMDMLSRRKRHGNHLCDKTGKSHKITHTRSSAESRKPKPNAPVSLAEAKAFAANVVKEILQPLYNKKEITRSGFKVVAKGATHELAMSRTKASNWKYHMKLSAEQVVKRHTDRLTHTD